jgi:hypothetical protein
MLGEEVIENETILAEIPGFIHKASNSEMKIAPRQVATGPYCHMSDWITAHLHQRASFFPPHLRSNHHTLTFHFQRILRLRDMKLVSQIYSRAPYAIADIQRTLGLHVDKGHWLQAC